MGTYTVNYNLFMPSVGEQGWGELVNGNFTTIDTAMKSLSNTIETLEPLSVIQVDSNNNVTFPGNITGNIIGKLVLEILGTNSNDFKICSMTYDDSSGNVNLTRKGNSTTLTLSTGTFNSYNQSIFNYIDGESGMIEACKSSTTAITAKYPYGTESFNILVTNTTDNVVVLNQDVSVPSTGITTSFTRLYNKMYTVKYTYTGSGGYNSSTQSSISTNTPDITKYAS